jgi:hypothetical protein
LRVLQLDHELDEVHEGLAPDLDLGVGLVDGQAAMGLGGLLVMRFRSPGVIMARR